MRRSIPLTTVSGVPTRVVPALTPSRMGSSERPGGRPSVSSKYVTVSWRSPACIWRRASSSSSATWQLTTSRHLPRSMVVPCLAAVSSPMRQCSAMASGPPGRPAPRERTPSPCLPALIMPAGVITLATEMGKQGSEEGHDGVESLVHALALRARLDPQHVGVGDESARAAPEHGAPARHVVELDEALGDQEGMVVGQAGHP